MGADDDDDDGDGNVRGGMIQTSEQYEFVHYAVSLFDQRRLSIPACCRSSSTSSSSTPPHDDDVLDLK